MVSFHKNPQPNFMNYFEKIRNLNNLQLAHFLNEIQGELELVGLALEKASDPAIICADDNSFFSYEKDKFPYSSVYWHRCLEKDFDKTMEKIYGKDQRLREQIRGWKG